jgi:hypothetical protein
MLTGGPGSDHIVGGAGADTWSSPANPPGAVSC